MDQPARLREILEGIGANGLHLEVADLKPGRTARENYFNAILNKQGVPSLKPVLQGLYCQGAGRFIKPWIEFRYSPGVRLADGSEIDPELLGFTSKLLAALRLLVGPGGSLMVIYGGENHPLFIETEKGLKRSFPPAVTPLGFQLWSSGCRWFKDWYFSEGWLEGAMKLQASYPLDDCAQRKGDAKLYSEVASFIHRPRRGEMDGFEEAAYERARLIVSSIGRDSMSSGTQATSC